MASRAQICAAGARAGVGKSYGLILCPTMFVARRLPATGVIFRRRAMDLVGNSSIVGKARRLYGELGALHRQSPYPDFRWRADGGTTAVEFRSLPELKSVEAHQGDDYDFIGFDELTHFDQSQFDYLRTRLRSRVDAGYRPHIRLTLNPIAGGWIRELFDWWIGADGYPVREREGAIRWMISAPEDWPESYVVGSREELLAKFPKSRPVSLTLIPGRRQDNPTQDWEAYEDQLSNQPAHIRASLLEGNWNVGPEDPAKIWEMPIECPFDDLDDDFIAFLSRPGPIDLYGAWDYGRAKHGLSWILGALEPGSPPRLWIIGARVWTATAATKAAADRQAFLESLDLPLRVGEIRECGDPAGWAAQGGVEGSEPGWAQTLRSHGVPLVDLRHSVGEDRSKVYWNTAAGFALTTDIVQSWLDSGRLRVRRHASTKPVLDALREWRLSVPEGMDPIRLDKAQIPPDKGIHSHPGDALRYLVAFVAAMTRAQRGSAEPAPSTEIARHAAAMRAASMMRTRGVSRSSGW